MKRNCEWLLRGCLVYHEIKFSVEGAAMRPCPVYRLVICEYLVKCAVGLMQLLLSSICYVYLLL